MSFSCEACAAQSYEANATRYDLAATARAITPRACNLRFWFAVTESVPISKRHPRCKFHASLAPHKVTKPMLRVTTSLRPRAQSHRMRAIANSGSAVSKSVPSSK